jgi:type II secretory pathway component GspD/PulD (secretin)
MKNRNSIILIFVLGALGLSSAAFAGPDQAPSAAVTVSVSANGSDVRTVLHDLFGQTKQNYVIEPSVRFSLYLSLDKVDFDEALAIICHLSKLKAEKQNGIYYVSNDVPVVASTSPQAAVKPKDPTPLPLDSPPVITQNTLKTKHVTTRLAKTDIRKVFAAIAKEAGVTIVVDSSVPACKLDAFLEKTTLKYALDQIVGAAKLRYRIVGKQSILIYSDETENRVSLATG